MDAQVLANIVDHISALIKRLDPNIGADNGPRAQSAASIVRAEDNLLPLNFTILRRGNGHSCLLAEILAAKQK